MANKTVSSLNLMGEEILKDSHIIAQSSLEMMTELKYNVVLPESVMLSERVLCDLEMLMAGAFNPLTNFLSLEDYKGCCLNMRLKTGEVWPIPIVLPVKCNSIQEGSNGSNKIGLRDSTGKIVAEVTVESVFLPDLAMEQKKVFGTVSENHPYVKYMNDNYKDCLYVGGSVEMKNGGITRYDYPQYRQTAAEVKQMLKEKGYKTVVGFQTRNPMHRAHMELTVEALRDASKDSESMPHLLITPAVGPTQPGDIDMNVRVRCYEQLIPYYKKFHSEEFPKIMDPDLVLFPLAMRMGGPREALWHAIIRKNYGCTHFVIGRDHAGPSSTNEEGKPFYGPYEAHEMMLSVEKELGIKVCYAKMFAFCGEEHGFLPFGKIPEGVSPINVSGTEQRRILENGEDLPPYFTVPEVSKELRSFYKAKSEKGLVIYLTGLPSSGKSTVADAVKARLEIEDRRMVTILDGDIVRMNLSKGLGFDAESRSTNVRRIGYVASLIAKSGGVCVCANIAPFKNDRDYNREEVNQYGCTYVEVFVDTELEICEQRDVKGLYAKARSGIIPNFTGISDPYERPEDCEITIKADINVKQAVQKIFDYLTDSKLVSK